MGSLYDISLQHKGVVLTEESRRFATLKAKAWRIAEGLRREVDR
jgi:hypothetical protein